MLQDGFQAAWNDLLAADESEPDLDRLAAYNEGFLTPGDQQRVLREMCESPLALEIEAALTEDEEITRAKRPTVDTIDSSVLKLPDINATQKKSRSIPLWVVAASLAVAFGSLIFGWNRDVELAVVSKEVVSLRDRAAIANELESKLNVAEEKNQATATSLLITEKERLALLTSETKQPYLSGKTSTELLRIALNDLGQPRNTKALADDDATAVERATRRVRKSAEQLSLSKPESRLESTAALIQAGYLDDASAILNEIESSSDLSSELQAQIKNVRATLLMARSASLSPAEAKPLWEKAEILFRQAAEAEVVNAWLNLAILLVEQQKLDEARLAAKKHLEVEQDPQCRAVVAEAFGI